jgi:hypothetical protein
MATIDNHTFRQLNGNATVYPAKANYWVIVVRRPDLLQSSSDTQVQALAAAEDFFRRATPLVTPSLRVLDIWPAEGIPKGKRYGLVQPQPMTYPEGSVYLSVTWDAPESAPKSIPWPWRSGMTGDGDWQDVREGLVAIFQAGSIVEQPGLIDEIIDPAVATVEQAGQELPKLGKDIAIWVAVGAASLFALSRAFK